MKRVAFAIVLLLAHAAVAHPLEVGNLRLDVNAGEIDLSLGLDISSVARLLGTDGKQVDAEALANATYRLEPIASCTWRGATAVVRERTVTVTDHATCGELVELRWRLPFVTRISPPFQLLVDAHAFDEVHAVLIDRSLPALELVPDAKPVSFGEFVWKGIGDIGATPSRWPDGLDHVLCVLALLLAGGSLLRSIGVASGFALGYTIALALAIAVPCPSAVIQPLIALSVALAAALAFTGKLARQLWKIAVGIGLVHGFGFARRHTANALLGYSVGLVIGQIILVFAFAPLVWCLHRYPRVGRAVTREVALAIFSVAMYWFVTRL